MAREAKIKTGIVVGIVAVAIALALGLQCLIRRGPGIGPRGVRAQARAERRGMTATKIDLRQLHTAVNQFHMDSGRWPTAAEGLSVLVRQPAGVTNWPTGGYLNEPDIPKDAWGNDFIYEVNPASGKPFVIKSLGADGKPGGDGFDADLLSAY